jgi:hypothetical protein
VLCAGEADLDPRAFAGTGDDVADRRGLEAALQDGVPADGWGTCAKPSPSRALAACPSGWEAVFF